MKRRWLVPGVLTLAMTSALALRFIDRPHPSRAGSLDAAAPPGEAAPVSPPSEAEELAIWFEQQVRDALAPATRTAPPEAAPDLHRRFERLVASGAIRPVDGPIDWEYLEDVYRGRVSGIPNERRAGLPLVEMVRLGDVPFVEALRVANDVQGLRDLDLDEAAIEGPPRPTVWPGCLRTATCRPETDRTP